MDPNDAQVLETHSAWVLLLGEFAFKVKKPLVLDFLDFATLESRRRVLCHELVLNRRLAPDVYLAVADVLDHDDSTLEHVLVMRRMPSDRRLSTLARAGVRLDDEIDAIARTIAAFHARAERSNEVAAAGSPQHVRTRVEADLMQLHDLGAGVVDLTLLDDVAAMIHRYLDGRARLFAARVARGQICDGHGDLLADDIFCLHDGPRILDCIEFDDSLRHGDVLADLAFLAMDLERLGVSPLATRLLDAYRDFSGESHPATLADYYIGLRALIRTKVACIRVHQGDPHAAPDARALLALAHHHLKRARVRLVLVGGPPGTGKSTLADALGDRLGWAVLHSDEVRKDTAGIGHATHPDHAYGTGMYDSETTTATYEALLARARIALELGESTILDASWSDPAHRAAAEQLADEAVVDLVELHCDAPPALTADRIAARRAADTDASDATTHVAAIMREAFADWPTATRIATTRTRDAALRDALVALGTEAWCAGPRPEISSR